MRNVPESTPGGGSKRSRITCGPVRHTLSKLDYLSNTDKHRLLNTTATALSDAAPTFLPEQDVAAIHDIAMNVGVLERPGARPPRDRADGPDRSWRWRRVPPSITFRDAAPIARAVDGHGDARPARDRHYLEGVYDRFQET